MFHDQICIKFSQNTPFFYGIMCGYGQGAGFGAECGDGSGFGYGAGSGHQDRLDLRLGITDPAPNKKLYPGNGSSAGWGHEEGNGFGRGFAQGHDNGTSVNILGP